MVYLIVHFCIIFNFKTYNVHFISLRFCSSLLYITKFNLRFIEMVIEYAIFPKLIF